jgi:hypothetical protein
VTVLVMLVLAGAPILAGIALLSRLTSKRAAPAKPTPGERLLRRPLSTGALVAWLAIPLLVIGLWATTVALTADGGQPVLKAGGVPGVWATSRGAMVIFAADGTFTETNLPDPPHDLSVALPNVPRSAFGTWKLEGPVLSGGLWSSRFLKAPSSTSPCSGSQSPAAADISSCSFTPAAASPGTAPHINLLEALLALATSEAGISHREPLDLAEITAASLRTASAQMQRQRLHAKTSLSPAPLLGDPALIERLAANLVDNAITHNTPGGTVTVTTGQRGGQAILTVTNTGPPIPPTDVERLFQPFQRLTTARTSHGHGHGLGLSIVKAIATAHNAVLKAHPRPEGGLHIEASFPASDCPPVR